MVASWRLNTDVCVVELNLVEYMHLFSAKWTRVIWCGWKSLLKRCMLSGLANVYRPTQTSSPSSSGFLVWPKNKSYRKVHSWTKQIRWPGPQKEKCLKTLSEYRERRCRCHVWWKTVPEGGAKNWKSPFADRREIEQWYCSSCHWIARRDRQELFNIICAFSGPAVRVFKHTSQRTEYHTWPGWPSIQASRCDTNWRDTNI